MDQQKIGTFISECRKEKGLTQAQFAEKLGVSDKSVSRWENGRTMPDMSLYEDICGILGVQVSELLYARRMEDQENITQGERSALGIFKTRSALETFGIFTEILIFVGIIITITLTRVLAETPSQIVITMICGCFVWAFGIVLRVKIRKALTELEKTDV
ncbi:MAG: helix-turn-helix transcriptional regulator [Firmicutes bacterium]|nr:helix-turn-helix transcriptional regulator [Bacillota bacterium]